MRKQLGKHPVRVFTFRGQPIVQVNTKAWTAALKRAGIEDFRWHDLRHTSEARIIPSAASVVFNTLRRYSMCARGGA
ncbi:MAG TPA: hypothetical protein VF319_00375 [Caldimonas sp.]